MPTLSRWFLKTSLVYLALGAIVGGIVLWDKGTPVPGGSQFLGPHVALMTEGWLLLLTMGVAFWILPRRGQERPHTWLAVVAYVCVNGSIWAGLWGSWAPSGWLFTAGGALQAAACLAFAVHAWPRVRRSG